jgi:Ni/Co efflux regulator RcnB
MWHGICLWPPPLFQPQGANTMKKLIAALILATSFAALADDAAKKEPAKTEKKATEPKKDAAAKDAKPAAEKAPEKK